MNMTISRTFTLRDASHCFCKHADSFVAAVQFMSMMVYWQKLIPGQNQNAEREYSTNALGTTHRYCEITGTTIVNGKPVAISAQSNTVTVTVVPQQG